jgi:hypothetical protein
MLSEQDSIAADPVALPDQSTVTPNPSPAWMPKIFRRIFSFASLEVGWNSYGAPRIDRRAIQSAGGLLVVISDLATPAPSAVPTVSGGVQFEWHQNGIDLEVEILASGRVSVFHRDANGDSEWESDVNNSADRLKALLSRLGYAQLRRN